MCGYWSLIGDFEKLGKGLVVKNLFLEVLRP